MCISASTMMALSTGVSVIGQVVQGQAQQKAMNAQAADQALASEQALQASKDEAMRIRKAGEKQAGAARAALAGAGVDVGSGTAININEDIYSGSESDAYNTLLTGQRKATSYSNASAQSLRSGSNAVVGSLLSAGATALTGWKGIRQGKT